MAGWKLSGAALTLALLPLLVGAQQRRPPRTGQSIGTIRVQGNLIVMTLNPAALGTQNLFNLDHRTLRFTPGEGGYRIENLPLQWDTNFGTVPTAATVKLDQFAFPFAGKDRTSMSVGNTGSITFPAPQTEPVVPAGRRGRFFNRSGGLHVARYFQMRLEGPRLVDTNVPAICVFFKTRLQGKYYVKQLADRVVVTWDLSLPYGGIQDWTWFPKPTRFQAVLYKNGTITMSYDGMAAKDGIVGVYPGEAASGTEAVQKAAVDFAKVTPRDGPFPTAYEAFHYYAEPSSRDLACTVIQSLGDKFDFLAYYSDFRIDNPEAGTPSNGPRGSVGGKVTGIGERTDPGGGGRPGDSATYCSQGRFQWGYVQPVDVNAIQMWEYPPAGVQAKGRTDIMGYAQQLRERTQNGKIPPYDYAMSQIGHEMDHRWAAFASAKVDGKLIQLGPVHWAMGLQARVPFAYQRPTEASAMGGGVWQDNHNGTYTRLDDNYFVPATGYSYLDLYLMGLIAPSEVPNFFILDHLVPDGQDADGHQIYKADRTDLTIQDVIAAEGPREPDVEHAQKLFNTGMVIIEQHGQKPSALLEQRVNGIRLRWMDYFATVTGHRAVMTANPR